MIKRIEALRNEMHQAAKEKGFTHQDTVRISQELDVLINQSMNFKGGETCGHSKDAGPGRTNKGTRGFILWPSDQSGKRHHKKAEREKAGTHESTSKVVPTNRAIHNANKRRSGSMLLHSGRARDWGTIRRIYI